jgi:hypothetical protein
MRRFLRARWVLTVFILALLPFLGWFFVHQATVNEMYPALDKLASIPLEDRWSKPEMIQIRRLGAAAVPPLRRVLREKDTRTTQFLFWVKTNWPSVTRYYSRLPDPQKMTERRWAACQVLQTLGPAAKPAIPELIEVMESKDVRDVNAGVMALMTVGIDAEACERLDESLEQGRADFGRASIINALGNVRPPSARTLNALTKELANPAPPIPAYAAEALGGLGVPDPAVIDGLKKLQHSTTDDLTAITCAVSLWQLQKDEAAAASNIFNVLERLVQNPATQPIGGGSGGQGIDATEQCFMKGAELFQQLPLAEAEKARALGIMESFCGKSGRIFVRMLLLPAMMDLGMTRDKCLDVCMTGLHQKEDYYRLQAAQLLIAVDGKFPTNEVGVNDLIHDKELGVRVCAAIIHWRKNKNPAAVVPVLADALDRKKYQSYYYPQILRAALRELGEIGAQASAAKTDVAALTKDPDPQIAQLATDTLVKLGK